MKKPVILSVDDEPEVLHSIERDLRRRFGEEYRILKAGSGEEALEAVRELKTRSAAVALLIADQRMPGMSGIEFLDRASEFFPDAKKTLLTAYADTEVAIASINEIGLDYYLMKPWHPPESRLYPVLQDLLDDWNAKVRLPFDGIRVLGTLWAKKCHEVKDFLTRNQIPYQWIDIERGEEGQRLLEALGGEQQIPVILFPDGTHLSDPELKQLAEKIGLRTEATCPFYDLIIIGGGPAGLAAAVYGGSEGLRTILIEREATGGQAGMSSLIENYLGFPKGLSGSDLARRATAQARRFGVEILLAEVESVRVDGPYRYVRLKSGSELSCHALVIASGVSQRELDAPGVEGLIGAGIYYGAAATEAVNYRSREVVVVGGSNSAGQGALFLSRFAGRVHMLIRGESLESGMSRYLVDQIRTTENIQVALSTQVAEVKGERQLGSVVTVNSGDGSRAEIPAAALFVFIGATPHTDMLDGVVERDRSGFILTGSDLGRNGRHPKSWNVERDPYFLETSVPGIFASGDVRHESVKRVASAVGEGAIAVALVHQYLKTV